MQRLLIILLFTGLLSNVGKGQSDLYSWDYFSYLKKNNLLREAITWLENYPENKNESNKIYHEKAQIFLMQGSLDSSHYYYRKCDLENDSAEIIKAVFISFIIKDIASVGRYISEYPFLLKYDDIRISYDILKNRISLNDSIFASNETFGPMINDIKNYKDKSPFVSAVLSALVPGMGKLYAGKWYQARSSFVINIVLGLVLAEAIMIPVSIIYTGYCAAISAVFYTGNIWGSSALVLKNEKDFYNQIYEDLSDYYSAKLLR